MCMREREREGGREEGRKGGGRQGGGRERECMCIIMCVCMNRTQELQCSGDLDFLAKLYCVRLAFDELVSVASNRDYFQQMGRELISDFLSSTGQVRDYSSIFVIRR